MSPTSAGGARIPKQAASISPASLKRQEEVLPMAKLEQRRYKYRSKGWRCRRRSFFIAKKQYYTCLNEKKMLKLGRSYNHYVENK